MSSNHRPKINYPFVYRYRNTTIPLLFVHYNGDCSFVFTHTHSPFVFLHLTAYQQQSVFVWPLWDCEQTTRFQLMDRAGNVNVQVSATGRGGFAFCGPGCLPHMAVHASYPRMSWFYVRCRRCFWIVFRKWPVGMFAVCSCPLVLSMVTRLYTVVNNPR